MCRLFLALCCGLVLFVSTGSPPSFAVAEGSGSQISRNLGQPIAASAIDTTVGGRDLHIQTIGTSIALGWSRGTSQTGYSIYRLGGGVLSLLPQDGPLGPDAGGFTDATPPDGLNCYVVFPLGVDPAARSDLLCAVIRFRSGNYVADNFVLDLNASNTAHFNWSGSGTNFPDAYLIATFNADGTHQVTPYLGIPPGIFANSSHTDVGMTAFSCYALGTVVGGRLVGQTDMLCALPGFTTLPPATPSSCTFRCVASTSPGFE